MNGKIKSTSLRFRRSHWSSEKAFIYAMAAAAVGLGNIWRFPYLAGENGGAAFIIAYLTAVVVIGVPLMLVEISAGRIERGGAVRTFSTINKKSAWFGWLVVALTFLILSYYLVVTGWTLGYAVDSLDGAVRPFGQFTGSFEPVLWFGVALVVTAYVGFRGVRLIEKLSRLLMPMLVVTLVVMAIYSLTLGGAGKALEFLFAPDFSALASPTLWALAFGQVFYSLAIGQGYLLTYGSFLPNKIKLPRATGIIAGVETAVALLAGLVLFPIIFTFNLNPAEGTELAFETLPIAFGDIQFGPLLAVVFFWLLFVAAISSCIASMQVIKTTMREEWNMSNLRATTLAAGALVPLGLLAALSFTPFEIAISGRPFLEIVDMFTANQVVVVSGLAGAAIIGWSIPRHTFINLFSNRYRNVAAYTLRVARYAWIGVAVVLIFSVVTTLQV